MLTFGFSHFGQLTPQTPQFAWRTLVFAMQSKAIVALFTSADSE